MTNNHYAYNAYERANETANVAMQMVKLFDSAIANMQIAIVAIKQKNHDKRYQAIDQTLSIIHGLSLCLKFDEGDEISVSLANYYQTIEKMLIAIQCDPKIEICENIIENLRRIKNIWQKINLIS